MRRLLVLLLLFHPGDPCPRDVERLVMRNRAGDLQRWLDLGGDPDLEIGTASLVWLATGPKGGTDVLRVLLEAGADPNGAGRASGWTPLMNAASWGSLRDCRLLVAHGADPNARTGDGRRAVDVVCTSGDDVIAYLKTVMSD